MTITVAVILIILICSFIIVHHLYKIKDKLEEQLKEINLYQNHISQSIDRIEQSLYQIDDCIEDIEDEIKKENKIMKQEEKELLLKDLCSRLPYGVKCNVDGNKPYILSRIEIDNDNGHLLDFIEKKNGLDMQVYLSEVKPYLFPLSNITEEQEKEYLNTCNGYCNYYWTEETFDWLNKNHIDYRGLIDKGLAIDATGLNIY